MQSILTSNLGYFNRIFHFLLAYESIIIFIYYILMFPQQEAIIDERTIAAIEKLRPKLQVTF